MSRLEDLGGVALLGSVVDLMLHGGAWVLDLLVGAAAVVLGNPELVVGLFATADQLAGRLPWVSTEIFNQLFTAALVAMLAIYLFRLADRYGGNS